MLKYQKTFSDPNFGPADNKNAIIRPFWDPKSVWYLGKVKFGSKKVPKTQFLFRVKPSPIYELRQLIQRSLFILEEIRHFFKADAPEHNRIPTVNIDFRSEDVIHFNAPLWGYENR